MARPWRIALELRDDNATAPLWLRGASIAIGLIVGVAVLALSAGAGSDVFSAIWAATFGNALGITQVLQLTTPLILAGSAVVAARWVGLWNVGVDGQLMFGAWAGTWLAFHTPTLSGPLLAFLMILLGMAGGAAWIVIPAVAKAYLGVNEIITTLMLNFAAYYYLVYWVTNPWSQPNVQYGSVETKNVPASSWFPTFHVGGVAVGLGFVVALVVVACLWMAFRYLRFGYHARLAGGEKATALYAGIAFGRLRLSTFLLSGAVAGLAGVVIELDQLHTFSTALSANTGYIGIVVAVLAGNSFGGVIPMALLVGVLDSAGNGLRIAGVSSELVLLVTGLLLVFVSTADLAARYRIRLGGFRDDSDETAQQSQTDDLPSQIAKMKSPG